VITDDAHPPSIRNIPPPLHNNARTHKKKKMPRPHPRRKIQNSPARSPQPQNKKRAPKRKNHAIENQIHTQIRKKKNRLNHGRDLKLSIIKKIAAEKQKLKKHIPLTLSRVKSAPLAHHSS
jgi:hypothetical protein